ncbi:hypothetical protein SLA2020_507840 [Shorea laevis]
MAEEVKLFQTCSILSTRKFQCSCTTASQSRNPFVILEYIDETRKQNPLLPEDPSERARARFLAKFCDDKVMPSMWNAFKVEGQEQEEAIGSAMENLKLANLMSVFEGNTGIKMIDEESFPSLSAWIQAFSDTPEIKESWPSHEKLVAKFRALREKFVAATSK